MQEYRILVVDDNLMSRKVMVQHLAAMGFTRIAPVASAAEAHERLIESHARAEPFHLILLDWNMPGEDGFRFLIKCREDERFASLPIIMATVENDSKNVRMAMNKGATSYIVKPVSFPDLKKSVFHALDRNEHKRLP
jgi:two-component system sensor histidine kinase/response regulator